MAAFRGRLGFKEEKMSENVIDLEIARAKSFERDKESQQETAALWQDVVNTIKCIPTSHPLGFGKTLLDDPDKSIHAYGEYDLYQAFEYRTEMMEMFHLRHTNQEIETVISAGLEYALDEMQQNDVSVCGIVVGTMRAMLESQQTFYSFFNGPLKHYPRRIDVIRADIESEQKRSRHLGYLEMELEDALQMEALAVSSKS